MQRREVAGNLKFVGTHIRFAGFRRHEATHPRGRERVRIDLRDAPWSVLAGWMDSARLSERLVHGNG